MGYTHYTDKKKWAKIVDDCKKLIAADKTPIVGYVKINGEWEEK